MKKIICLLSMLFVLMLGCALPTAHAEFAERPVGFVVLDYDGNVDTSFYRNIYSPVRWAYHFPYYKIHDEDALRHSVAQALTVKGVKVTPEIMGRLCEENKMDVLVVAKIYAAFERQENPMGIRSQIGPMTRVVCMADLHCYRKDNNKLLTKYIRENFLDDTNSYDPPREMIKWQMSKLVNTMEGRPIIGADD